jgi:hypothetical protein
MIRGRGNSGAGQTQRRIALMRRYIKLFGVSSIRLLLADREFIGHDWADFPSKFRWVKTTYPSPVA